MAMLSFSRLVQNPPVRQLPPRGIVPCLPVQSWICSSDLASEQEGAIRPSSQIQILGFTHRPTATHYSTILF